MKRIFSFVLTTIAVFGFATTSWAQAAGAGGGAGGAGGAGGGGAAGGAGAAGAAGGAGAAGTAGGVGNAGTANAGTNPVGVTGTNPVGVTGNAATGGVGTPGTRTNGTGANTGVRNNVNPNAVPNQHGTRLNQNSGFDFSGNGISQTPFFNDRGVRQQLNLNDSQFNSLNSAYQNAYNNYSRAVNNLNSNLTPLQRAAQMQQLENQFNNSFGSSVDSTFTNPRYRTRYDQLNRQYMGFNAFNNPAIQSQLNLTPRQQMQIRQLAADWRRQQQTNGQESQMYSQYWDQLDSVLTPQQQQIWTQLTGERYAFPTNVATPNAGSSGTIGTPGGAANGMAPPNGTSPTGVGTTPAQVPPSGSTRAPQSSAAQSGLQPASNTNSSSGAAAEGTAK